MNNKSQFDSIMLDWETMGTGPQAAVIQLGAAAFNSTTGETDERQDFLSDIDLVSSLMLGGYTDASTVQWWRERGGFPSTGPARDLRQVLIMFAEWVKRYPSVERVWAQGASFDIALAEGYYRSAKLECPWAYHAGRDTRTIYDEAKRRGWTKPKVDVAHEAREDCRQQVKTLMSAFAALREQVPKS